MTNKRIEKLTAEELNIVLKAFHAPYFMKANINAGGEYTIPGVTGISGSTFTIGTSDGSQGGQTTLTVRYTAYA